MTRGSAVRLQAGRSLAKRCIEGGLQVRRRSEQKNKSALSGSDRGISNGYQGSESGLHPGDPKLGTCEIGMAGRIRRSDIIHEVRRM